jgi:Uncharacterised nucleotidyltransferase
MRIDATAVEVARALAGAGIQSILLKGPSIARWLYSAKEERPYFDCDVLVPPDDVAAAEAVLTALGYKPYSKQSEWDRPQHGMAWVSDSHLSIVDLHRTLGEATADPATVWEVLSQETEWMDLNEERVRILNEPARTLHVAAHLAQHGVSSPPAMEDLRRAIAAMSLDVWRRAAAIGASIGALDELVYGLSLVDEGAPLLHQLGLAGARGVDAILRERGAPPLARGVNWMLGQPLRKRIAFVLPNVFLSQVELQDWSALARRGPVGLALAYVWRPLWVLGKLPRAWAAVRRARREEKARRTW